MSQVCAATCGFCASTPVPTTPPTQTCADNTPDCKQKAFLCNNKTYQNLMSQVCASTCGFCTS
ncbi:Protein E04D5.4 a, partial [Aphelenchoides avenae]